ncbi:hypothetical protein [Sphingobacterium lactis]|uniref:hypothetical protein n=1 Tax=Sphingobacterium lactis TaxID=797291 RepID=UPI003DA3AD23
MNTIKYLVLAILSVFTMSITSCKKDNVAENDLFNKRSTVAADYSQSSLPVVPISGAITSNTTWTADKVYELSGIVTVKNGATLTIQAGTYIKSSVNVAGSAANGVLVISKGAKLNALGEASKPIVFTSRYLLDGNNSTLGKPGDFGGLIVLGRARINDPAGTKLIEGLPDTQDYYYGSNSDANNGESSGTIKYVRIEFGGYILKTDVEVNGLTLGGVGSGTTLNNVQVSWGLDDGFEFFGGRVNASDLISFSNDDDQFDFDLGYQGTISNSISIANKVSTHSASGTNSDSNGAEIDNHPSNFAALPKTIPTFNNVRIIGTEDENGIKAPGFKSGILVRRGAELSLNSSIITGYKTGLHIHTDATPAQTVVSESKIHGFTLSATIGYTDFGGNTISPIGAPAPTYGITQPFFNKSGFNPNLAYTWSKFDY